MASTQGSPPASSGPPLPPNFSTIQQINNVSNEDLKSSNKFFNVIAFVADYRPPISTRGTDWKCTFAIRDLSTSTAPSPMEVIVFWPLGNMPVISGAGDIVLIREAKVQMWSGAISLLANKVVTQFHVLPLNSIPRDLSGAPALPWVSCSASGRITLPSITEQAYAIWANTHREDIELPSALEFKEKTERSTNVTEKFRLLRDVQDGRYCNMLGEVIRITNDSFDRITVYLSDYTPNTLFYNRMENPADVEEDEYSYSKRKAPPKEPDWPPPYGKMSIQLTVYDAHAQFVRESVKEGMWVSMRNVQIKFGKMGGCLEGFLRGDRQKSEGTVNVDIMEQSEYREVDPRWKEAIGRKHDYEKKLKSQMKGLKDGTASSGNKRKPDEEHKKPNSKQRRKEQRAAAQQKVADAEAKALKKLDLNDNIRCSYPDEPIVSFARIMESKIIKHDGEDHVAPFTVCKYRANVRVVDYFPHKLEDFAVGYRSSEYEMLSDYSGNEDTDPEEDRRIWGQGKGFAKDTWEWRFALQVEDASSKDSKDRLWLIVDNHSAQLLLGFDEDATSLRTDKKLLNKLRDQLFMLWGDLEEEKSAKLPEEENFPPSSYDSIASSPPPTRRAGDQPDADDSDVEMGNSNVTAPKDKADFSEAMQKEDANLYQKACAQEDVKIPAKNKPFTCCIRQYGIKVKEIDPLKADALHGERWQRIFGLFGTQIM